MAWRKNRSEGKETGRFCARGGRVEDCREIALEVRKEEALRARAGGGWRLV